APADLAALGGLTPLVEAANPILAAVPQIRHALRHPDPAGLRARLREQIGAFERAARAAGVQAERLGIARFALCALIDDSAMATPWGRQWGGRGLLAEVEGEGASAEKFFAHLDQAAKEPAANRDLLEFFYVCIALGFEGRYRSGEGGRHALAQLRTKVYELLAPPQPEAALPALSANWRGAGVRARRVPGLLALWAAASGCALLLAGLYLGYSISLGSRSDPVARELARLQPVPLAGVPAAAKAPGPGLGGQLAEAIGRREVSVSDVPGGAVIVLHSDELFASGSSRLDAALHPVIERVAGALDGLPGTIVVTGHTDDVPIRTARYPSNWELSTERARSVVALMAAKLRQPSRLRAEGLADSHPIAPNDGAGNRAKNRRVEIILRTGS
ncbi:MAG: type VI secretion system protein TssL, long form, partial [Betaproteobacteria bacterium]